MAGIFGWTARQRNGLNNLSPPPDVAVAVLEGCRSLLHACGDASKSAPSSGRARQLVACVEGCILGVWTALVSARKVNPGEEKKKRKNATTAVLLFECHPHPPAILPNPGKGLRGCQVFHQSFFGAAGMQEMPWDFDEKTGCGGVPRPFNSSACPEQVGPLQPSKKDQAK